MLSPLSELLGSGDASELEPELLSSESEEKLSLESLHKLFFWSAFFTFVLRARKIFRSILLLVTRSFCSILAVSAQAAHPYRFPQHKY